MKRIPQHTGSLPYPPRRETKVKKGKLLACLLSGLLFFNGAAVGLPAANSESSSNMYADIFEEVVAENTTIAGKYFGGDPSKKIDLQLIGAPTFSVDGRDYRFVGYYTNKGNESYFHDAFTDKIIMSFNSFSQTPKYYDYFEKGTELNDDLRYLPLGSDYTEGNYPSEDGYVTTEQLLTFLLKEFEPDINKYFSYSRYYSLDKLEYKNTIPSSHDNDLLNTENCYIAKYDDGSGNYKFFPLDMVEKEGEPITFCDVFTREIIKTNSKTFEGVKENRFGLEPFQYSLDPYKPSIRRPVTLTPFTTFYEFIRPLRQCIEVIDGVEYYNVGKLRKVFENIPEDMRLDYSYFMTPSGSGAALETTPTPPPYADLTLGSRGQEVLDMKGRFYELGYFRTDKYNDQFSRNTADTVRLFEENNGLPVDGIADPEMLALLFSNGAVGR